MIHEALKFLADEVNRYLISKIDPKLDPSITKWVVLDNVAKAQDAGTGTGSTAMAGNAILTLVNMEEDRISKSPHNYTRVNDKVAYKNPAIHLNLYCLFSVNLNTYSDSLKYLSFIVQFFQYRNVFNQVNSPKLPLPIEKLVLDLYTLNFEQVNHLWGTLGGKYLPSALYKARLITLQDDTPETSGELITSIDIAGSGTMD